jgi:protein TonB
MIRRINLTLLASFLISVCNLSASAQVNLSLTIQKHQHALFSLPKLGTDTDRDRDGLVGPVRRVKTETVKLSNRGGKTVEGQRAVLESVAYDIKGVKIENAYFPVPGASLTGKEVYKYDDKGNIVEMTLLNTDGSLLSKETYTYEFDGFGNWTKMTTSVAVIEGGKINFEPTEVTYRSISYYLDGATLAKMTQPATPPVITPAPTAVVPPAGQNAGVQSKSHNAAAQPANVAASKPGAPLPSGAALIKTNMTNASTALSMPASNAGGKASLKVEGEPPPVAKPKPLLRPMSGGVLNGKAVSLPVPVYPPAAKSMRASGLVTVDVVIDETGKVISAKALNGQPLLQQAAVQAAKEARFSPTLLSGQPVKITGQINYNFALAK